VLAAASTATTQPTRLPLQLLSYFFQLLTDYRSVEAIVGDACHAEGRRGDRRWVKPITFFALN
jgi:hypothetical protein